MQRLADAVQPQTRQGLRDRALVLVGFAVPYSAYCPAQAVLDCFVVGEIGAGALFQRMRCADALGASRLTDQSVALIIKRLCVRAGTRGR